MIEEALFSHLSTTIPLVNERVYPSVMPQDCKKPALVFTVVNDADKQGINGGSLGFIARVQIDCYSNSYLQARELKDAVKKELYNFSYYPHGLNSRYVPEPDTKLHRQLIDFNIKG